MSAEREIGWAGHAVAVETAAASTAELTLRARVFGRLRRWGWLSALSLVDQGLTSGAGFAMNLLLARLTPANVYGEFAVAYAGFLFIAGFHNVIFIEPMTTIGPSCYSERLQSYFRAQLRCHVILLGAISALCAFAAAVLGSWSTERSLAVLILTAGLSLPFLLLLWLARRMCYVVHNPFIAAQASAMYFVLLLGGAFGLKYFGSLNSSTAFLSMAVTSLLVSIFILRRLGVRLTLFPVSGESSFKQILLENWEYGHWLTLTTALSWVSVQAQTFLAAGFLGLAGAGILRAMQLPSLAMSQVVAATMLIALPSMSRELGQGNLKQLRKKAILCGVSLTAMGAIFVAALFLFAVPLEKLLFAGKYASFSWLIPVLGLVPLFVGFSSGFSFALRLLRKAKFEFLAYLLSAGAALTLAFMLMPRWGLAGAAASIVGGTAVLAIAVLACFLRWGNA